MYKNLTAYFQGGGGPNEPAPKKKKYKSDKAIVVQPRFEEPFYKNYDLYDVPGKHGPGTGAYRMDKHKSVQDFLKEKRKKLKDKYKAKDSWIEEDDKKQRMKRRAFLLNKIIKNASDFSIDSDDTQYFSEESDMYPHAIGIGGRSDRYFSNDDFEGKGGYKLNSGRDYENNHLNEDDLLVELFHNYNPSEPELLGLPNGISPEEDLDADKTVNNINPYYGKTDSGNTIYDNMWI